MEIYADDSERLSNSATPSVRESPIGWTEARPRRWWMETGLFLPRRGALRKFLRRAMMTSEGRAADIAAWPDRPFLTQRVLPAVAARGGQILFMGVRAYTQSYYALLESQGGTCWTLDFDPQAAAFGQPGRHCVGDALDIETLFSGQKFSAIILGGIVGDGIHRRSDQVRAFGACANMLTDDGLLVVSWNDRRMHFGVLEDALLQLDYTPLAELPPRLWVAPDQQYAFLKRRAFAF